MLPPGGDILSSGDGDLPSISIPPASNSACISSLEDELIAVVGHAWRVPGFVNTLTSRPQATKSSILFLLNSSGSGIVGLERPSTTSAVPERNAFVFFVPDSDSFCCFTLGTSFSSSSRLRNSGFLNCLVFCNCFGSCPGVFWSSQLLAFVSKPGLRDVFLLQFSPHCGRTSLIQHEQSDLVYYESN